MQLLPLFVSDVYQVAKELVTQVVLPVGIQNLKVEMKSASRLSSANEFGIREKTVTRFTVHGHDGLTPMGTPAEDHVLQLNGWIKNRGSFTQTQRCTAVIPDFGFPKAF